jgi:phage major head subunit gpT-like protein
MTMISENWPNLLAPGLRKVFHSRLNARESLFKRSEVFPIATSQRAFEDHQGIGEIGTAGFNEFAKTGQVPYDRFDAGYKTRFEHRKFAEGIIIERELMDDNLYADAGIPSGITKQVTKLADAAAVHREKSAANVFINAFTDSGTDSEGYAIAGADAVGLCSTAHPLGPSNSSTQSNEGTSALTSANVTATKLLMRAFTDDRGELVSVNPDTLLVPPELEETAEIIVGSDKAPSSANNDVNTNKGRYNVVSWDYLTDANAWFLIDSMLKSEHLIWFDRIAPEFASANEFDTLQAKFRAYYRYSRGWDDFRWVFGQNPS